MKAPHATTGVCQMNSLASSSGFVAAEHVVWAQMSRCEKSAIRIEFFGEGDLDGDINGEDRSTKHTHALKCMQVNDTCQQCRCFVGAASVEV